MGEDERTVLRAAAELTAGDPWLIEFAELVGPTGFDVTRIRAAAIYLHARAYCFVTFGGMQLTAGGMRAASQA